MAKSLRTVARAFVVIVSGCHPAPPVTTFVQECIEMPGFVIVAPGTAPDTQLLAARGLRDPRTAEPAGLGAIVITVFSARGPLQGAAVVMPDTDGGHTDKDGRIELRVLAPREHHIRVAAPGLLPQELGVVSRTGFRDSVRVYLTSVALGLPCDQRP